MTPISFERAIEEKADIVECDISVSRDLQLLCSHESWMEDMTNVADVFPSSRKNTYFVDDQDKNITDYFTVDFSLDELQTIGKRQRYSSRDPTHDDLYPMATAEQCLQIVQGANWTVGFLAEIKDPIWLNSLDFMKTANATVESLLLDLLSGYGYTEESSSASIQSFNHDTIQGLRQQTPLELSVLVRDTSDTTDEKFAEFSQFANSVGLQKSLVIVTNSDDQIIERKDTIERAHSAGLGVNIWTFRNEDTYLAWDYGQDIYNEMQDFLNLGTNGFITDFPETGVRFLNSIYNCTA